VIPRPNIDVYQIFKSISIGRYGGRQIRPSPRQQSRENVLDAVGELAGAEAREEAHQRFVSPAVPDPIALSDHDPARGPVTREAAPVVARAYLRAVDSKTRTT